MFISALRIRGLWLAILLLNPAVIASAQPNLTFSVYPVPFFGAAPGITAGPDGALWFVNGNSVWRTTTTGLMTEYVLPDDGNVYPSGRLAFSITLGPDGALWFTELNAAKIGRITIAGIITEYRLPGNDRLPVEITAGPDGALWFTEQIGQNGRIGRITTTGLVTEYALSPCPGSCGRYPNGITAGPDGALWFTDLGDDRVHRITTTGSVSDYGELALGLNVAPGDITTGPDGALWFTAQGATGGVNSRIGRITTTGMITTFPVTMLAPRSITSGPDGALWFTSQMENSVGRITPGGQVTLYTLPPVTHSDAQWLRSITAGPDGALWITNEGEIVRASLPTDTTPPVISGMPAPGCTLWPPNNAMVRVGTVSAADTGSGVDPDSFRVTGTSNEPFDPKVPDILISGDASIGFIVSLRAARLGNGTGRVYTLTVTVKDRAGNAATSTATCIVPHDRGN